MSKELPYFKFYATEWMTGRIVHEPLEVQGLFINVCALYWKYNGILKISEVETRFKRKNTLAKLTDRFFSVNGGFLKIPFLDEQLSEIERISEKNSENGKKGGRPVIKKIKPKKSNIDVDRDKEGDKEGEGYEEGDEEKEKINKTTWSDDHFLKSHIISNYPTILKLQALTPEECEKLLKSNKKTEINEVLMAMENYKGLEKKYKSAYLTINNWLKNRKSNTNGKFTGETKQERIEKQLADDKEASLNRIAAAYGTGDS